MEALKNFFDTVGGWVWGPAMLVLLVGTGVWLTLMLRGLQFSMLWFALKQAFKPHGKKEDGSDHEGDISHFGALMTALSATIGTGNIAGVATAVVLGGPGAVGWRWITAIFGMATKYGEGVLAVKYRVVNKKGEMSGGPMYYIERGMKRTTCEYLVIENRREAIRRALQMAQPGDVIVLAGKGHETYQEIRGVKHPFDEKVVVKALLEELAGE